MFFALLTQSVRQLDQRTAGVGVAGGGPGAEGAEVAAELVIVVLAVAGDKPAAVRVQDAAWLADQAFFAIQAVCDNPDYEMHPEFNFDVDGGLSDDPNANEEGNHYRHWLWTEKGFGLPEDVMDNPDKKLLVYYGTEVHIGTPQGEVLMGASDAMKVEGNSVLIGLTFERAAYETGPVKAAILRCTDAKGYLTLCYPYETRLFANNEFGGIVDHGCVTFKVKIR